MAAAGVSLRTLQEFLGHRDFKTTLIYADYAPSDQEADFVERAFADMGTKASTNLTTSQGDSEPLTETEFSEAG